MTKQHKIEIYENFLNSLYVSLAITGNKEKTKELHSKLISWGYAQRFGEETTKEFEIKKEKAMEYLK